MKKLLIILLFISYIFISPKHAEAIPPAPTGLNATADCGVDGKTPRLLFRWDFNYGSKYDYKFWRTGMSNPISVSTKPTDMPHVEIVKSDPPESVYSWYLTASDIGYGIDFGTSKSEGEDIKSLNCSNGPTPTPTPSENFNCARRSLECSSSIYPNCTDYSWSDFWGCSPKIGCTMQTKNVSHSCATKDVVERCSLSGEHCTINEGGSIGDNFGCCAGYTCNAGTNNCEVAPTEANQCTKCPNNATWNESNLRCENELGKPIQGTVIECGPTKLCIQGDGCKDRGKYNAGQGLFACEPNNPEKPTNYTCHTAIGDVETNPEGFIKTVLALILGLAGGILLIVIILNGYKFMVSQGDPEKIKDAREGIIAAVTGILLIIFSLSILSIVTSNILGIPGFR